MKDVLIALASNILWITFIVIILFLYRMEIRKILSVIVKRIDSGSSIKAGPIEIGQLQQELSVVNQKINEVNNRAMELFLTTMSPNMFYNLSKLTNGNFGRFEKTAALVRELYHLRDIGYIEIDSISKIPDSGCNLSDYVKITEAGNNFVSLRMIIEEKAKNDRNN